MAFIFRPGIERIDAKEKAEEIEKKLEVANKVESVKADTEGIDKVAEQIIADIKPEETPVEEIKEEPKVEEAPVVEENHNEETAEVKVTPTVSFGDTVSVDAGEGVTVAIASQPVEISTDEEDVKSLELQLELKEKAIDLLCEYAKVSKEDLAKALSEHKKLSEVTGKVLVAL